jgi:hypothetical protein
MSYDFRLCLPRPGRDPMEIALADIEEGEETALTPAAAERNRRLVAALLEKNPDLEGADGASSAGDGMIVLTDPAEGSGIEISLSSDEAAVSLAYWHGEPAAQPFLEEAWDYLRIIEREGDYFTYDPQLGRVLDLQTDFAAVLAAYQTGVARIRAAGRKRRRTALRARWFPPVLDRLPYLTRWVAWTAAALLAAYLVGRLMAGTRGEFLIFAPFVGWMAVKMLVLDRARFRSMGLQDRATFLSLFPPLALWLQVSLFFSAPRLAPGSRPAASPAVKPDAAKIYPYVVPADYLEHQPASPTRMAWPLGHGLHEVLVHDLGTLVRNVSPADLVALGLTPQTARQRALANLADAVRTGAIRHQLIAGPQQRSFLLFGGHWSAAAAILLPDLHRLVVKHLGDGNFCACLPHREALLVFAKGDRAYREEMRAMIREREGAGYKSLSFSFFELGPDGVRELHE